MRSPVYYYILCTIGGSCLMIDTTTKQVKVDLKIFKINLAKWESKDFRMFIQVLFEVVF